MPKSAFDGFSKRLWPTGSGAVRSLDEIRKASVPAAKETNRLAHGIGFIKNQLKTAWHMDGLGRAVETFREGREELSKFRDKADGLGKMFGPAGTLLGLGSLAGIGGLVEGYGTRAGGLYRTAGTLGVSPGMLQSWQGAGEYRGLGGQAATTSIDALQQNLRFARLGMPQGAEALGAAKRLGLNVRDDPAEFLKHLADRMQGHASLVQRAMAQAFGVEDLLPLLRQGRQAIEEYTKAADDNRKLTDGQIEAGRRLEFSYNGAIQATLGLKDALGAQAWSRHSSPCSTTGGSG